MSVVSNPLAIQSRTYWQSSQIANSDKPEDQRIEAEKTLALIAHYAPSANLRHASVSCLHNINR